MMENLTNLTNIVHFPTTKDNVFVNEGNPQSICQSLVYASFIKVFPVKLLPYKIVTITFSVNVIPMHCV